MSKLLVFMIDHPHPDPAHVAMVYRKHLLVSKRKFGTARGLVHYRQYLQTYLHCKRLALQHSLVTTEK